MKILERIKIWLKHYHHSICWLLALIIAALYFYRDGYNQAASERFDYKEAQEFTKGALETVHYGNDDNVIQDVIYQPTDWNDPILIALDPSRRKNAVGEGYTWCVLYTHKTIPHRKLILLYPFFGELESYVLTKPVNIHYPEVQKIMTYTRYPECDPFISIYSNDMPLPKHS